MVLDESMDVYTASGVSLNVSDPAKLPRVLDHGACVPLWPHQAIRTNTIFEVAKAAGGRTAWADKHPAYEWVNGPSGTGVDDHSPTDRKSTRLNSSHTVISYAVFCLKKKKKIRRDK